MLISQLCSVCPMYVLRCDAQNHRILFQVEHGIELNGNNNTHLFIVLSLIYTVAHNNAHVAAEQYRPA